jgi:hypothetical protein
MAKIDLPGKHMCQALVKKQLLLQLENKKQLTVKTRKRSNLKVEVNNFI